MPDPNLSPLVEALLADRGLSRDDAGGIPLEIDPRDEMLSFLLEINQGDRDRALFLYFLSGLSIADTLGELLLWRFGGLDRVGSVLDFASGYGRVTRFLLRHLPPEKVWISDIYDGAVEFQRRRFGVHGLASALRPEDFSCDERFDAILVTSLFTHLREDRFVGWLRRLGGLLNPGGLLVFSVHDQDVLSPGQTMPECGILFEPASESTSLDTSDYGSAWVTEAFVRSALAEALRALPEAGFTVHRVPRGIASFQDLYAVVLAGGERLADRPVLFGDSQVFVERCAFTAPDRLEMSGWAAARGGSPPSEVQIVLDGEVLATAPVDAPRPDVAAHLGDPGLRPGWKAGVPLPPGTSRSRAVLLLRTVDAQGRVRLAEAGSVDGLLLSAARRESERLQRELWETAAHLRNVEAHSRAEIEGLRARLSAMEASRFWRARNAWFRAKRALGITEEA